MNEVSPRSVMDGLASASYLVSKSSSLPGGNKKSSVVSSTVTSNSLATSPDLVPGNIASSIVENEELSSNSGDFYF